MEKWFFVEELRYGFVAIFHSYVLFCTEETLSTKVKEKSKNFFGSFHSRKVYELTSSGEQKQLEDPALLHRCWFGGMD